MCVCELYEISTIIYSSELCIINKIHEEQFRLAELDFCKLVARQFKKKSWRIDEESTE